MSIRNDMQDFDALLDQLRSQLIAAKKAASLAERASTLSPLEEAGKRIKEARAQQKVTLNELSDLCGVAYGTLVKIESGHPSVRLDLLVSAAGALGLKLWIG